MRILIVGAGATGGAFGTLLQEAGRDVTYLVRRPRAEALRRDGLRFISPSGDRTHSVQVRTADEPADAYDLILVTVKASALPSAIEDMRPAIGSSSTIVPVLNGMAHIDRLQEAFPGRVAGGMAKIVATLDAGAVRQLTQMSTITIGGLGERELSPAVAEALRVQGIDLSVSADVEGALWEKWMFIAAGAVATCLFRSPIGATIEAGGLPQILGAISELEAVAAAAGHPVSAAGHEQSIGLLTEPGSAFTTSLYRDLLAGLPTEAEHILGDLARRARELEIPTPLLDLTLIQVRADAIQRGHTAD
ncbi:2-dehydropantoate 2-reductase [Agrococcus sp. ARC_14]|uniref:ketopantoate reductase family protein n=1 Tax=Agrococcus sp. ARC_14 TaxID=2919927 RepID=UPI001F065979|nr:2-dehydropantoate 2-reductase [Agrococcus sp. ARC_14]MCH1883531.1 2-dehydropantoate 2-reductase [Agrococcus sp. ARC_14]